MGTAYTPGLKVTENELLKKRRILPLKGEVMVEDGATVNHVDVVARTFLPGKVYLMNIANKLGVDQADVPAIMLKKQGDLLQLLSRKIRISTLSQFQQKISIRQHLSDIV